MDPKAKFQVLSLTDAGLDVRDYKRRTWHTKTKSGCQACRAKKVKCDGRRPVCVRCRRNSRLCAYDHLAKDKTETSQSLAHLRCATVDFSVVSSVTVDPFDLPDTKNGTSSLLVMQHLQRHCGDIFHMPGSSEIMSISQSHSLVRNTILAIGASHLRHCSPSVLQHRTAEHFQLSLALQNYRTLLAMPREELGRSEVVALLLSAVLLNMIAFVLPQPETASKGEEPDPSKSWVFSPRQDRLGWLSLQIGIKSLLLSVATYVDITLSFLGPLFIGPDKEKWAFGGAGLSFAIVPETWIRIFGLYGSRSCDCETTRSEGVANIPGDENRLSLHAKNSDVYRAPVLILAKLRHLEPVPSNVFANLQYLGKIQAEFQALLYARDERALWLFGYWLGLMCRYQGTWWCDQRARRDYKAIRMWLDQLHLTERPGMEGEMWREMMREYELAPIFVQRS